MTDRTREGYEVLLRKHVVPNIGHRPLQRLTAGDIEALYGSSRSGNGTVRGLSAQTTLHVHRVLHACLKKASKIGMVGRNVAADVNAPKSPRPEFNTHNLPSLDRLNEFLLTIGNPVTPDQKRWKLTSENRAFLYWLCFLAAATGMRLSELLALRWCDFDLMTGSIRVARAIESTEAHGLRIKSPKSGKPRSVVVPQSVCGEFRKLRQRQRELWMQLGIRPASDDEALMFPWSVAEPDRLMDPRIVSQRFRVAADAFGLSISFHDLRHLHVSVLLQTLSLPEVAARAGHSNPSVTARLYAHALEGSQERAAEAVDALLAKRLAS